MTQHKLGKLLPLFGRTLCLLVSLLCSANYSGYVGSLVVNLQELRQSQGRLSLASVVILPWLLNN